MQKIVISLVFLFITSTSLAIPASGIQPYVAQYRIKAFGLTLGKATRQLKLGADGQYNLTLRSESKNIFVSMDVREESRGNFKQNRPHHYAFKKETRKKTKRNIIDFDWIAKLAHSQYKGHVYQLPLTPGTQDKLSYQLQMRKDLIADKKTLRYLLADEKKIEAIEFHIDGHETVKTGMGKLDTLKISKISDPEKRSTTIWLAPKYHYLPVKLKHVERGTSTTMTLDHYDS